MDVTSLYTNIPQEGAITTVCRAYEYFHQNNPPIPTHYLREMLRLILKENSFQFNGKNYLQIHVTATGTKLAIKYFCKYFYGWYWDTITIYWRYFSLWDISKPVIDKLIDQANANYPAIKFTAKISSTETTFLDTVVYEGKRFQGQLYLNTFLTDWNLSILLFFL